MAWVSVEPRTSSKGVVCLTGKVTSKLSVSTSAWQGDVPPAYDVLIDSESCRLRIQGGTTYQGTLAKSRKRIYISLALALQMLNVKTPGNVAVPYAWKDGGMEIDLNKWKE